MTPEQDLQNKINGYLQSLQDGVYRPNVLEMIMYDVWLYSDARGVDAYKLGFREGQRYGGPDRSETQ